MYFEIMELVLVIPPNEFKDETVSQLCNTLEKWKVNYSIASTSLNSAIGSHGAIIQPKIKISDISTEDYDGIVLLNGVGVEEYKLYDLRALIDLIKHFNDSKKLIAGIGNGLKIVARANIISNKNICSLKDSETIRYVKLFKGIITENEVEHNENLITASNSDKVNEFSKIIVNALGLS